MNVDGQARRVAAQILKSHSRAVLDLVVAAIDEAGERGLIAPAEAAAWEKLAAEARELRARCRYQPTA
jgi:hypothetical protein